MTAEILLFQNICLKSLFFSVGVNTVPYISSYSNLYRQRAMSEALKKDFNGNIPLLEATPLADKHKEKPGKSTPTFKEIKNKNFQKYSTELL